MSDVNAEEMSERLSDPETDEKPGNKRPPSGQGYGTGEDAQGNLRTAEVEREHLNRED